MASDWKNKPNKKRSIQCPMLFMQDGGMACKITNKKCADKKYNTLCEIWISYNKDLTNKCTRYGMIGDDGICCVTAKKCEQEEDNRKLSCYNYQKFMLDVRHRENDKYETCPSLDNCTCLLKINEEAKMCDDKRKTKLCKLYQKHRSDRDATIYEEIRKEQIRC